jgi:hypothetical protein
MPVLNTICTAAREVRAYLDAALQHCYYGVLDALSNVMEELLEVQVPLRAIRDNLAVAVACNGGEQAAALKLQVDLLGEAIAKAEAEVQAAHDAVQAAHAQGALLAGADYEHIKTTLWDARQYAVGVEKLLAEATTGGMDGWLVLGQNGYNYAPMGLFATKSDAYEFARACTQEDVVEASYFDGRDDDVINVSIVEFRGGAPGPEERIHDDKWTWADLPDDD